jgi:hypothetical protein
VVLPQGRMADFDDAIVRALLVAVTFWTWSLTVERCKTSATHICVGSIHRVIKWYRSPRWNYIEECNVTVTDRAAEQDACIVCKRAEPLPHVRGRIRLFMGIIT